MFSDLYVPLGSGALARDLVNTDMYYGDDLVTHKVDPLFLDDVCDHWIDRADISWPDVDLLVCPAVSGIALAVALGIRVNVPVLFARKTMGRNIRGPLLDSPVDSYTGETRTRLSLSSRQLRGVSRVVLVDDFLSTGAALTAVLDILHRSCDASVLAACVAFRKSGLGGDAMLRDMGCPVIAYRDLESGRAA
ncbi:phosphoribosyltransferase family protein [Asanoa iriomotensis]|uniref:Xanthine phosphoribosyltransferase n=1 Tax=Asanoa iriomotensis TaxID=234613 RepID=A0ABQ4C4U9_9ACTN|nr:phosphoribosyltransferase family protein [Asanoa iriomotensis]GIF57802.1 xanthine phosphoribosyltransferase [Asanoa iriomotensis]